MSRKSELAKATIERIYWQKWAKLLGWRLLGWTRLDSATFVSHRGDCVGINGHIHEGFQRIAGDRAPKLPELVQPKRYKRKA